MRLLLATVVALGFGAPALAADEDEALLVYRTLPSEKDRRAGLPAGASSTLVKLSCLAQPTRLSDCTVLSTTPPAGAEVGAAGAKLAQSLRIDSRDVNGKAVAGRRFAVEWALLAPGDKDPDWLRKPTPATLKAVAPRRAMMEGKSGTARLRCDVTVEGYLDRCEVLSETPVGYGFGDAALVLTSQFVMTPKIRGGKAVPGEVSFPVNWEGLESAGLRPGKTVMKDPTWLATPSPAQIRAAFPATAASTPAGQASLRCRLETDGRVTRCEIASEIPPSKAFGAAARGLAPSFQAAFPQGEKPPTNTLVEIPFRFRNPTAPDDGRLTDVKWVQTLSAAGASRLYPQLARNEGIKAGMGQVDCVAAADGALVDCRLAREEPAGKGFGQAALEASKLMKMNRWTTSGDPVEGRRISLPFRFKLEDDASVGAPAP